MKKLLSIILTILMIVTSVPFAFAAESDTDGTTIVITMEDIAYDGWNGNAIQVGFVSEGVFTKIADATIDDGANATYETVISDGEVVAFRWTKENFPEECSFTISVDGETVFEKSNCGDFLNDEIFYVLCEHNFSDSVCSVCGYECGSDFKHNMTGNECSICGLICNHVYTNHYCKLCDDIEVGYYAGYLNDEIVWSLSSEGTLTISGTGYVENSNYYPWYNYMGTIVSVVIEEGIIGIGDAAFANIFGGSLSIPSTLEYIGKLNNCGTEIILADGNTHFCLIDGVLFNYDKTELVMYPTEKEGEEYTVPDGVTALADGAFSGVQYLRIVNISDDVIEIGENCFDVSEIENIKFGANVEIINREAFMHTKIKTIIWPEKVSEMCINTFFNCNNLENIIIGSNVKKIQDFALYSCDNLKRVHFLGTEEQWNEIKPQNTNDQLSTIEVHFGALEEKDGVDATCGEAGHTSGLYCDECDAYITGEEIPATGEHDYVDSKCKKCGDECDHEGQTGAECEICGTALHVCDFSGEWQYDSEKHWKECSCGEIGEEAAHTYSDGNCDICETTDGVPLTIDVTDEAYVSLGERGRFYDKDGYIITGTNENCDINVYESSNITLRNLSAQSMGINSTDGVFVTINLEGINELAEDLSFYKEHIIFEGSDDAIFKADYIYNGGNGEASVTLNGGNIVFESVSRENFTVNCGKLIINGGTLTASNDSCYVIGSPVELNGGELNIISTSQQYPAILKKITMKKGALLTLSAKTRILDDSAEITVADGLAESDNLFVRYDTESEFVTVYDIEEALNGKTYAEIKVDTHVHSYEDSKWSYSTEKHWKECSCGEISEDAAHTYIDGACECGYECDHEGQTGAECEICGSALHVCDFSGEWQYDSENHWKNCSCGVSDTKSAHTFIDGVCECGYVCSHNYTNHYCKACGKVEDGYYAGVCGAEKAEDAIWSLDAEGTLTISGEGEYSVPFYDAPWLAYKESIKNVVIEEGITNIPWTSFYGLFNAVSLSIPSTVASIDPYYNNGFAEIKVADGNNYYSVIDGVLFNHDKTELIMYPVKKADETYTVPDGVKTLGKNAFNFLDNLKTINISDDVTTIKDSCFEYASVESINFGKNVEVIESGAFAYVRSKTVVLPEKLNEIPCSLFYACYSLENLVIGSKVTSIDNDIISYCDNIETVHFTGTEEQWQAITKPDNSEDAINTIEVHFGALEEKDSIDATCAEAGHTAGLYCDECNAYLTGEEIPATGNHTYVDGKCECGDECKHPGQTGAECEICGSALHVCDFSGEWNYSDEKHWKECSCGETSEEAAHTYIDGKCDVCGAEAKDITITMTDRYGDGWSNNAIQVGFVSEGVFTKIADATIDDGSTATYEITISDDKVYAFRWTKGYYPDECSFTISVDGEIIFEKSDCSDFADNEFIYIDCNHNYTDSVCSICGLTCGVDFSHNMNGSVECISCGYVCSHNYTNHYCKACGKVEDGYYAGACGANDVNDVIWSLDSEGTLIISGEGEYDITYCDAPWKAYGENIKNVVIEEGITKVPSNSFEELPNAVTLSIPSTVASIEPYYNNGFAEIKVADRNNYYSVIDGVLFNHDKTELIMYPAKKADETYTVPDGVTILGSYAFYLSENLKTVNISDDVTTIEAYCFNCASIENINFGKNVEVVEFNAFPSTGLKTMVLPEKLTEISLNLLYACYSLETLVIGSKVTSIDSSVIQYCNKLKTVHFTGTEEQWQAITKPDNSADKINTIEVHCGALEEKEANDATCTEVGHTAGLYCDECNAYITGEEIPATGNHTYVDGKCECGDECKHPGQTGATCEICGSALHVCDFSGEWNYSDEDHWKECSCGEISAEAEHTFTDGKCDCGYVCDHAGQTGICTICGMTLHVCDFSGEWQYDSEKHWKECTCGETSAEAEHTYTDSKCDCGFECPHEETYNNIIRPVQNADGTWGKGTVETICNICTKVTATKEVERADYTAADAAVAELKELLETEDLLDAMKNIYTKRLNIALSIIGDDKIESEQNYIDDITQGINKSIDEIKEGLKDGTMVKADFTYMGSLLDEVKSLTDNNPDSVLIPSMVEIYIVCNNIYNGFANDSSLSQSYYDEKIKEAGFEAQLEALIEAIKDGTALKADYAAIDEAIAEIEEKLADENVTDEAKSGLEEIKAQLEEMKADENTSAADLAELEKALEDYEAELDAGIEDGSAVKVDGLEEIVNINDKLNNELAEKYGEEALAEIAEKLDEKFADKFDELYERAEALTGSVAENKDALAEIEAEMEAIFAETENCLNGTHNGLKFEVTEEAKCGKNAVESAVCTLCGETVTREVENSALKHSFTKYEVTEEAKCGVEGKEVATCDRGCGATDEKAIEALRHSFTKYEVTEEAKCGVAGKEVAACDNGCGATDEKAIAALTHKDADGDYKCDNGCGHEFQKPTPDAPTDKACDHLCHKGGFVGFIWKIVQFFWKLFKMNPVCECGAAHY